MCGSTRAKPRLRLASITLIRLMRRRATLHTTCLGSSIDSSLPSRQNVRTDGRRGAFSVLTSYLHASSPFLHLIQRSTNRDRRSVGRRRSDGRCVARAVRAGRGPQTSPATPQRAHSSSHPPVLAQPQRRPLVLHPRLGQHAASKRFRRHGVPVGAAGHAASRSVPVRGWPGHHLATCTASALQAVEPVCDQRRGRAATACVMAGRRLRHSHAFGFTPREATVAAVADAPMARPSATPRQPLG